MSSWRRLFRLGLGRPDVRQAVDWEIEHHLAEVTDRLVEQGMTEAEARREAERRFGDLGRQRKRIVATDRRRVVMRKRGEFLDAAMSVLRQTFRGVRRSPGLSAAIVLTLGLGVGVNAAMFGVVDRLLLSPPDHVANPDLVRRVYRDGMFFGKPAVMSATTYPDLTDLRAIPQFASVGAVSGRFKLAFGEGAGARQVQTLLATHDFFATLGVGAELGRFFVAGDDEVGAPLTVVLSHEFWQSAFGGDPGILGRTVELSGHETTVVGVAPPGFTGIDLAPVDVWLPAVPTQVLREGSERFLTAYTDWWLRAVVRLRDLGDVTAAEAQATAVHVNARGERGDPDAHIVLAPLIEAYGPAATNESKVARWTAGVSLIVLLIACANVTNLLLARGAGRRREVAVRLSLGVSRRRLFWETALETLVLATGGGLAALVLARWGGGFIRAVLIPDILWTNAPLGIRVVVVTLLLSLGAGILAGFGPAAQATRADLRQDLAEGGRGASGRRSRLRSFLTVAQATLAVVLLVGAGLFVRSVVAVRNLDLGMDVNRLVQVSLEFQGEDPDYAEATQLYQEAMATARTVPGVADVAATDILYQWASMERLSVPGLDSLPVAPGTGPFYYGVTPGYLKTMGLRLLSGRALQASDGEGAPGVAVVNELMATTLWPGQDPLGKCFIRKRSEECTTVVGVVEATKRNLESETVLAYYVPLAQASEPPAGMYVRTARDPGDVVGPLSTAMRSFSPRVRFAEVRSYPDLMAPETRSWTLGATLFTAFGLLALVVAAIGLYSLLAFDVAQRTRELGIRVALGARKGQVLSNVITVGARLAVVGVLLGLAASAVAIPYARSLFFHMEGFQPGVLGGVGILLMLVSVCAALIPGLRATRVDPMEALRPE